MAKAKTSKKKKSPLRTSKTKSAKPRSLNIHTDSEDPPTVPLGYRAVNSADALVEYLQPLFAQLADKPTSKETNEVLEIGTMLWNYALELLAGSGDEKIEYAIVHKLEKLLEIHHEEAKFLFFKMMARYQTMFPEPHQPKQPSSYVVIRDVPDDVPYAYDSNSEKLKTDQFPSDQNDLKLISKLNELDKQVTGGKTVQQREKLYAGVRLAMLKQLELWLKQKGMKDHIAIMRDCVGDYLDFVYEFFEGELITAKMTPPSQLETFLGHAVLIAEGVGPNAYSFYLAALRLFYQFLYEKGYIRRTKDYFETLEELEKSFYQAVSKCGLAGPKIIH